MILERIESCQMLEVRVHGYSRAKHSPEPLQGSDESSAASRNTASSFLAQRFAKDRPIRCIQGEVAILKRSTVLAVPVVQRIERRFPKP
jgi:hypothetical protein